MQSRDARRDELEQLSALILRSKAVWGYDDAFMRACRAELTLHPAQLDSTQLQVVESDGEIVGVAQVAVAEAEADLLKLFIEPSRLRSGAGRLLFSWAVATARSLGAMRLVIEADPGAAAFYRRMGARDAGWAPSGSIPGRMLPRLSLDLREQGPGLPPR